MPRFENLIFFLALAVMCMLVVIQLHWNFESAEPVDTQQSHQVRELNNTLYALNAALKDMLKDAKKRRKFPDEDIFPPETLKTNLRHGKESGLSNGLVGITTPNPIRVEVNGSSLAVVNELIPKRHKKAVIFTMDSISQCELLVRYCLQEALEHLGVSVTVIQSDKSFNEVNGDEYDYIILDPWTWAARGWVPKPNIRQHLVKLYILDFFGTKELRKSLDIPLNRVLTPFGTPWNTFLGFYLEVNKLDVRYAKKNQGVIWGKDPKHFKGQQEMLVFVSGKVPLLSTSQTKVFSTSGITWLGHQTPQSWKKLLAESKFIIGLGDPLLGPSAIDAVAAGCMYINPIYDKPVRDIYSTQHDFAANQIGFPHVCSVKLSDRKELSKCIEYALSNDIEPFIPEVLSQNAYLKRVQSIFS